AVAVRAVPAQRLPLALRGLGTAGGRGPGPRQVLRRLGHLVAAGGRRRPGRLRRPPGPAGLAGAAGAGPVRPGLPGGPGGAGAGGLPPHRLGRRRPPDPPGPAATPAGPRDEAAGARDCPTLALRGTPPMRVVLSALCTADAKTGVGHYTTELIRCL